eukprot:COSAG01_NODE_7547_length_3156_cov_20.612692_2_plen_46_part_00
MTVSLCRMRVHDVFVLWHPSVYRVGCTAYLLVVLLGAPHDTYISC